MAQFLENTTCWKNFGQKDKPEQKSRPIVLIFFMDGSFPKWFTNPYGTRYRRKGPSTPSRLLHIGSEPKNWLVLRIQREMIVSQKRGLLRNADGRDLT